METTLHDEFRGCMIDYRSRQTVGWCNSSSLFKRNVNQERFNVYEKSLKKINLQILIGVCFLFLLSHMPLEISCTISIFISQTWQKFRVMSSKNSSSTSHLHFLCFKYFCMRTISIRWIFLNLFKCCRMGFRKKRSCLWCSCCCS